MGLFDFVQGAFNSIFGGNSNPSPSPSSNNTTVTSPAPSSTGSSSRPGYSGGSSSGTPTNNYVSPTEFANSVDFSHSTPKETQNASPSSGYDFSSPQNFVDSVNTSTEKKAENKTQNNSGGSGSNNDATTNIPSAPPTNITQADTQKSGITGGGTPTWSLDYYAVDKSGTQETQTWKSSNGAQVAFAGISAAELAKYEAEKGRTENAAIYSKIAAASAVGLTSTEGLNPQTSASNWRNSKAGEAISLGVATPQDYATANMLGANYVIDTTGNIVYQYQNPKASELVYPGVKTTGSNPAGSGIPATVAPNSGNIPIDTNSGNIPIDTPSTPTPQKEPEPTPVKDESPTLIDLITLRLGQLIAGGGGGGGNENTDGTADGGAPKPDDGSSEETKPNYIPAIIICGVIVVVIALLARRK